MKTEKIEITFETLGGFENNEYISLLDDIRIVIEQRPKTEKITVIRL